MVELSTFVGQIIADLANARSNSDYFAASMGEQYHADPFVKCLPIPHYIIEEADIEVPVMVVGITKRSEQYDSQKSKLLEALLEKLPILLLRSYKFNYVKNKENAEKVANTKLQSEEKIRTETNKGTQRLKRASIMAEYVFPDAILDEFSESAKKITEKMVENTGQYMDNYNYEILKLLDMSEDFSEKLSRELAVDMASFKEENRPYADNEAIMRAARYIGNLMFFEFKKIMKSSAAVQVDINTVQMNEYATKDCLMHIKLKIKEQDLNLLVETKENGKERRYLSLT